MKEKVAESVHIKENPYRMPRIRRVQTEANVHVLTNHIFFLFELCVCLCCVACKGWSRKVKFNNICEFSFSGSFAWDPRRVCWLNKLCFGGSQIGEFSKGDTVCMHNVLWHVKILWPNLINFNFPCFSFALCLGMWDTETACNYEAPFSYT